ncbi:VOC family protein [Oryzicola mucosus]|uniref:VOC family protein n=1 Tax=Oryzicola mucosus TaxID=2767425 RepID=A0A8J6U357_9HYPH|nr:VOC family protein [Oryzicola mucosus]MBD0416203.1 VOC family protein [Oryzicola mucosus]
MAITTSPRPLDHLVLPTATAASARNRLEQLGFTVAPDGIHPFGTQNCCVYFADGTFIEPLAVVDQALADAAISCGNVFVGRDRSYRARNGDEGLSALVLATENADADHVEFAGAGISAGDRLDFSRPFIDAEGARDTASFRLAFAAEAGSPDSFVFSCERVNAPKVDRSALQAHANGVTRIRRVLATAQHPEASAAFLAQAARSAVKNDHGRTTVDLANAVIDVSSTLDQEGFRFAGIVFGVADIETTAELFSRNAVEFQTQEKTLRIAAADGQGVPFHFEADR